MEAGVSSPLKLKVQHQAMGLPGQGNTELYLIAQSNGTYQSGYGGGIIFGTIPHKTSNFIDGEQVENITIEDPNGEYLSVQTIGPYFTIIRPTFVGSIAPTVFEFSRFCIAYSDFIEQNKNPDLTLIQPYLPNLEDYVNIGSNGQHITTGQVIMSSASPSLMSVVSSSFVPPVIP